MELSTSKYLIILQEGFLLASVAARLIPVASIISLTSSFDLLNSWFNSSMQSKVRRIARTDLSSGRQFISITSRNLVTSQGVRPWCPLRDISAANSMLLKAI